VGIIVDRYTNALMSGSRRQADRLRLRVSWAADDDSLHEGRGSLVEASGRLRSVASRRTLS